MQFDEHAIPPFPFTNPVTNVISVRPPVKGLEIAVIAGPPVMLPNCPGRNASLMSSTESDMIFPFESKSKIPAAVNGPPTFDAISKPAIVKTLLPAGIDDDCVNASPTRLG